MSIPIKSSHLKRFAIEEARAKKAQKALPQQPTNIQSLPNEILYQIIDGLHPAHQFSFGLTCRRMRVLVDWLDVKAQILQTETRYDLARVLSRPGSYLCSGCKTRHSAGFFLESEKRRSSSKRKCVAWSSYIFLFGSVFIPYDQFRMVMKMYTPIDRYPRLTVAKLPDSQDMRIYDMDNPKTWHCGSRPWPSMGTVSQRLRNSVRCLKAPT